MYCSRIITAAAATSVNATLRISTRVVTAGSVFSTAIGDLMVLDVHNGSGSMTRAVLREPVVGAHRNSLPLRMKTL
jgi:hypothetical protein